MFIGIIFFKAEFKSLGFVFLALQAIFLLLMISAKENWEQSELYKNRRKMGNPQFNRKELIEKLLKTYSIEDLAMLTDNQLYQLCRS